MAVKATWEPLEKRSDITKPGALPNYVYGFPEKRKLALRNAADVRYALANFGLVQGVNEGERHAAFENIRKAADFYGVIIPRDIRGWRDLCQ